MTVSPDEPGFYHGISRCVRRAWLCGEDPVSGRNFDHRHGWIEARLIHLAGSFAVGLYAWTVMSNHTHVVLRIDPGQADAWTEEEVARWARIERTIDGDTDPEDRARRERMLLGQPARLAELRQRLGSLSWFRPYRAPGEAWGHPWRAAERRRGCRSPALQGLVGLLRPWHRIRVRLCGGESRDTRRLRAIDETSADQGPGGLIERTPGL